MSPLTRALFAAINHGSIHDIEFYIDEGANPNDMDDDQLFNSLILATAVKNWGAVDFLLQRSDVDIDAGNAIGLTPLMIAAEQTNRNLVSVLLLAGADQHRKMNDGSTALSISLYHCDAFNIKQLMKGRNARFLTKTELTAAALALETAIKRNDRELIQVLSNSGILGLFKRKSVIQYMAAFLTTENVVWLVLNGINPHDRGSLIIDFMVQYLENKDIQLARDLMRALENNYPLDKDDRTLLHLAVNTRNQRLFNIVSDYVKVGQFDDPQSGSTSPVLNAHRNDGSRSPIHSDAVIMDAVLPPLFPTVHSLPSHNI